MKYLRHMTILSLVLLLGCLNVQAAQLYANGADEGVALRVYNGDADEDLTIVIAESGAAATNSVTIGSTSTTIDGSGATVDIISELSAAIAAATNSGGSTALTVDDDCALASDSTDGELLDGSYTAAPGDWAEILWDTSVALRYDVYVPNDDEGSGVETSLRLTHIGGQPSGTGDVNLYVYVGRELVSQLVYPSPTYRLPVTVDGAGVTTNETDNFVNVDWDVDIPVNPGDDLLIRATRATTATTGHLNCTVE